MARIREDQPLVASVFDRLIMGDHHQATEPPKSRVQVLRELKQSVRRDLEKMLNTRWRCKSWPPNLDEMELSLVNYGIPDFAGANMGTAATREELRRVIERMIKVFEPRFVSVKVSLPDNTDRIDRVLHFRIDALLHAQPEPEPVTFDSQVDLTSADIKVSSE
jgi:type VI secretion system protein ImpF